MLAFHLSTHVHSRKQGHSSVAAAAYRSGSKMYDERCECMHDYGRKRGIEHSEMLMPGGNTIDRSSFWNSIEKHHKRGDAILSREVVVALPAQLNKSDRESLTRALSKRLSDDYGVAADFSIHSPRKVSQKDLKIKPDQHIVIDPESGKKHNGNWHAHIMLSACQVERDGSLGKKAERLDPIHCQKRQMSNLADIARPLWAGMAADRLQERGFSVEAERFRNGHLTLPMQVEKARERGDTELVRAKEGKIPDRHIGQKASAYERRTGKLSFRRFEVQQDVQQRLATAKEQGEIVRQSQTLDSTIIDLRTQLSDALAERDVTRSQPTAADRLAAARAAATVMDKPSMGQQVQIDMKIDKELKAMSPAQQRVYWEGVNERVHDRLPPSELKEKEQTEQQEASGSQQSMTPMERLQKAIEEGKKAERERVERDRLGRDDNSFER
jgi:MobA/MobL family